MDMITSSNPTKDLKTLATARRRLYERALEHSPHEERTITLELPRFLWQYLDEKAEKDGNISSVLARILWNDRFETVNRMERLARDLPDDETLG